MPNSRDKFSIRLPDARVWDCKLTSEFPNTNGDLRGKFIIIQRGLIHAEIEEGTYPVCFAEHEETKATVKPDPENLAGYLFDIQEAGGKLQYEGDLVARIVLNHRPPAVTLYFGTPPGLKYRVFSGTVVAGLSEIADNVGKSVPTIRIIDGQKFVFDETTQVERMP